MSDINFEGSVGLKDKTYHLGLSLVEFSEDNVIIIYSPALDLSGYGYTRDEAKKSFQVALHEFFKYTTDKETLNDVLISLGWTVKNSKKHSTYTPPLNSDLVLKNPLYNEIINSKDYKSYNEEIRFAV